MTPGEHPHAGHTSLVVLNVHDAANHLDESHIRRHRFSSPFVAFQLDALFLVRKPTALDSVDQPGAYNLTATACKRWSVVVPQRIGFNILT
jgi:hypothetical protein